MNREQLGILNMEKMIRYMILQEDTLKHLTAMVNIKLLDGWTPQGGVSMGQDPAGALKWVQAITITETKKDKRKDRYEY
jgi:hypothetical protein